MRASQPRGDRQHLAVEALGSGALEKGVDVMVARRFKRMHRSCLASLTIRCENHSLGVTN